MKDLLNISVMMIALGLIVTGCSSVKPVTKGATEVTVPFSEKEYRSDKDFFRASQTGLSPDLATAKKIALANAKSELAGIIESTMKVVTENYTNQRSVADKQEFENKFEEYARVVVVQQLNDVRVTGEKTFAEKDGKFRYYVVLEMAKDAVQNAIAERIAQDDRLKLDFDKFQFKKIFDEEMKKYEESH
jgi:hypothetical protein